MLSANYKDECLLLLRLPEDESKNTEQIKLPKRGLIQKYIIIYLPVAKFLKVESVFLMQLNFSLIIMNQEESHLRRFMGES